MQERLFTSEADSFMPETQSSVSLLTLALMESRLVVQPKSEAQAKL